VAVAASLHVSLVRSPTETQILPGTDFAVYLQTGPAEGPSSYNVGEDVDVYLLRTPTPASRHQLKSLVSMNLTSVRIEKTQYHIFEMPRVREIAITVDGVLSLVEKEILLVEAAPAATDSDAEISPPAVLADDKQDAVDKVDGAKFRSQLVTLSQGITQTRYTHTTAEIYKSADWIQAQMRSFGYTTSQQQYTLSGTVCYNVIAEKRGTTLPGEVVVIGAHYDSTAEANRRATLAPGAVDNGSGSISVLQAAEALAAYSFKRTIQFVVFSGEEQGLHGSTAFVRIARENGVNIRHAVILDMIAYSNQYFGVTIEGTTNQAIQRLMNIVQANLEGFRDDATLEIYRSNNSFGSDHVPFQRAGIPAILLIEADDTVYPHYHRTTDVVSNQNVDVDQSRNIIKGAVASVWDLANE